MYNIFKNCIRKPLDLSNRKVKRFIEIPPYAKDDKGKIINMTSEPVLKENGEFDIQDYIQSFYEDCDLYHLLAKVARTGDISLLNQKQGVYADISNMPDNIHDAQQAVKNAGMSYSGLNENEKLLVLKALGISIPGFTDKPVKDDVKEVVNEEKEVK